MELRSSPRHKVNTVVALQDVVSGERLGMLVNLSDDGFMMIGPALVADGNIYQIKIHLSDEIDGKDTIDIAAECLWTNTADSEDKIWSGHRIIDISDEDRVRINQLIEQMGDL